MYLDIPTLQRGLDALTAAYRRRQDHDHYDFPYPGIRGHVLRALDAIAHAFPALDASGLREHLTPGASCDRPTYDLHDDFTAFCDLGLGQHLVAPYSRDEQRAVVGFMAEAHLALFACLPVFTASKIIGCPSCVEDAADCDHSSDALRAIAMAAYWGWLSPALRDAQPAPARFRMGHHTPQPGTAHVGWAGANARVIAALLAPALHHRTGATIDLDGLRATLHIPGNQDRLLELTAYAQRLADEHLTRLDRIVFTPAARGG